MPPVTPQDIPLEQSERLPFTPASLASIPGAPSFVLRSPTRRDERHHRRLLREEGIVQHSDEAIRAELFVALAAIWSPEDFDRHAPRIREYYAAVDEFRLQAKDNADLKFEWDEAAEQEIQQVVADTTRAWPPLRRMIADNGDASDLRAPMLAAVIVESWTGLATKPRLDRGYLSLDTAQALFDDLAGFEDEHAKEHGLTTGEATVDLFVALMNRMYLGEDAEKNSASPSPSPARRASSRKSAASGGSKAPASSPKTPVTA